MLKIISILTVLVLPTLTFAQSNVLFDDQFNDNSNEWYAKSEENYGAYIENGEYFLETKQGARSFSKSIYLNPEEDYYIETSIRLVSQGEENFGFGLIWASSGRRKYYFDVSKIGSYLIYGYPKGEKTYFAKWTRSEAVSKTESNIFAIQKKGETTTFFLNGTEIHREQNIQMMGKSIGFTMGSNTKIAVDYLLIKHPPTKINIVPGVEKGYAKENLGPNINSEVDELHPLVSHDGKYLYVTRDEHPENLGEKKLQDIWLSMLQEDNTWGPAAQMPRPVNSEWHNSITSVSPDNNSLFMDMDEGDEIGDKQGLYVSHRVANGWSEPEEIIIDDYYNNNRYESYHISANRKTMITSLERNDTYGEKDLYVCFRKSDGSWSAPRNLGSDINTFAEEMTPFMAADNKTLYFASFGYMGYGSADIYISRRLDDSWTKWSKPQNLGPEINSKGWDAYFTLSAYGDYAYMVSYDDGGQGGGDAFRIKLSDPAKPYPVTWINGVVYDKFTNNPMQAEIRYEVLGRPEDSGVALSDPETGYYQIVVPYGDSYDLRASATGHVSLSEHIDISEKIMSEDIERDLFLEPIVVGKVFNLQNILFKRGSSELIESSYQELDKLVILMIENPTLTIELGGHTDNRGDRNELMKLSSSRVEAVKSYLVRKGIVSNRITGKGYGRSKPITKNRTEEERKQNRRVEFKVLEF